MITGKNCSRPMKTDNLSASAFMIGKMNRCTGNIVLDAVIGLSGLPEIVSRSESPTGMGPGEKIFIKGAEVIRKVISWFKHDSCLTLGKVQDIISRAEELFYVRLLKTGE